TSPEFQTFDKQGERLPDGIYTYEIRLGPSSGLSIDELKAARPRDDEAEADRVGRKRLTLSGQVQSGSFSIVNGQLIVAGWVEESPTVNKTNDQPKGAANRIISGNTISRLRNHRLALAAAFDQVIADDLIVQGSACIGLDCVNNESFGFDTVRLK